MQKREKWSSQFSFILAGVGATIGLAVVTCIVAFTIMLGVAKGIEKCNAIAMPLFLRASSSSKRLTVSLSTAKRFIMPL